MKYSISRAIGGSMLVAAMTCTPTADARGGGHGGGHSGGHGGSYSSGHYGSHGSHSSHGAHSSSHHASSGHSSRAYAGVKRDGHGRIARDPHAKEAFRRMHPCPATGKTYGACPGWVVDHVQALKHGGADAPWNMQWQTRSAAKAKDRWE
jgi:hypothetical protein